MSIALSVLLGPSRRLLALRLGYAVVLVAAAIAIVTGQLGCYAQAWPPACACLTGALLAAWGRPFGPSAMTRRLDVSGLGELRLTVQQSCGPPAGLAPPARASALRAGRGRRAGGEELLVLLPGSTLWPAALLLRLRDARGAVVVLAILPDSVARGQFRAVAVAFATIAQLKIF